MLGDCRARLKDLEDNAIDSVVTDPPYELGFMGKKWDSTGITYDRDLWAEVLRVLKPGGFLLSFGGTRTYHRMACAIEDSGFEIRDMIEWVYGTGFPKSLNVSKAIDKELGAEREKIRVYGAHNNKSVNGGEGIEGGDRPYLVKARELGYHEYAGNTPISAEAKQYDGWGTALKPAHESILVARKPLSEATVASNVLKWGTGGLNIDACKVGFAKRLNPAAANKPGGNSLNMSTTGMPKSEGKETVGRWPANFIHDGAEDLGDNARYFYCIKPSNAERNAGLEQNDHPTVKPITLMRYLNTLVTPVGGTVLDPFLGSGTTGCAAVLDGFGFVGIELEKESFEIAKKRILYWRSTVE